MVHTALHSLVYETSLGVTVGWSGGRVMLLTCEDPAPEMARRRGKRKEGGREPSKGVVQQGTTVLPVLVPILSYYHMFKVADHDGNTTQ